MKSIIPLLINMELRIQSEVTDNTTQLHNSLYCCTHDSGYHGMCCVQAKNYLCFK